MNRAKEPSALIIIDDDFDQFVSATTLVYYYFREQGYKRIDLLAESRWVDVALASGRFSRLLVYKNQRTLPASLKQSLEEEDYQSVYYGGNQWKVFATAWKKRVPTRIGPAEGKGWQGFMKRLLLNKRSEAIKQGIPLVSLNDLSPWKVNGYAYLQRPGYIVIEPFGSALKKWWPFAYFEELVYSTLSRAQVEVVVNLSQRQKVAEVFPRKKINRFIKALENLKVDFAGKLRLVKGINPLSLVELYKHSKAVVGNYSSEIVLAKQVGARVMILSDLNTHFENLQREIENHSLLYVKPELIDCHKDCQTCPLSNCLQYIPPHQVFEKLKEMIWVNDPQKVLTTGG